MEKTKSQQFDEAIEKLRNDFPMVYIEAWTPNDFAQEVCDESTDGEIVTRKFAWDDPVSQHIVGYLVDMFDGNDGTTWESIAQAVKDATA